MRGRIQNILIEATAFQDRPNINTEFWRWFGGSAVRDASGDPLVVYHGTDADFSSFKSDSSLGGSLGFWFASKGESASKFSTRIRRSEEPTENVMPVYLHIQNPKEYDTYKDYISDVIDMDAKDIDSKFKRYKSKLKRDGHDGIVIHRSETDDAGTRTDYVVFLPEQVKSIHNQGSWNPYNKDIME